MRKSPVSRQIAEAGSSDIIVYPNRRRMIGWLALSGVPTLCHGLGTIGMIILMITIPEVRNQGGAIALVILLGSFFVMGTWLTRMLFSVTFSGEPTLVINHAGIRVGKIYGSADIFLPWEEVEAIYSAPRPPYKIFFVRPVDSKLFFSRLSPMMRFTCRLSAMGGAPIALYQSFLDQPAEAILEQMQTHYKQELQLHKAKKQAEEMLRSETGKQEIILYTSRLLLWAPVALGGLSLLFGFIVLFNMPWQLSTLLGSAFLMIAGVFFGPITIWRALHTPLLIMNDEGISSPRILKHTKIKWEEIGAIYCRIGGHLLIDTSPSGIVAFLTRRNRGRLVIPRSMDITIPQTVLTVPQNMLPIPLDRLLEQIRTRFQNQLERYNIELTQF